MKIQRFYIGKFSVSDVDLEKTLAYLNECVKEAVNGYVCVSNARVAYQSNHDEQFCNIQNNSLLTLPDGKPLSWIAHNKGFKSVQQVAGNELFHGILRLSEENNYSHFFYGSTPDTIFKMRDRLKKEFPNVELKGCVSPPFQPIEDFDIEYLADMINNLAPTFLWVGLGAPKQERLMALLQPKLKETICIGVGLVFEYYGGSVKRAPEWARKIGLEWLVRIMQQPARMKMLIRPYCWTLRELIKSYLNRH